MTTLDKRGRGLHDLRVSVTDRCNFRCTYCMPRELFGPDHAFLDRTELLSFEEITRVVSAAAPHGIRKIRLTGGEPLLRRGLHELVGQLKAIDGIDEIAMTTNGVLLPDQLPALIDAGLDRVTVSLDALDPGVFAAMADVKVGVDVVTGAIDTALAAGMPVKVNAVVQRGVNESQIVPLATMGREKGVTVRFIEFMDVGSTNSWSADDVVGAREIVETIAAVHPVERGDDPDRGSAVAKTHRYADGRGEFGVIASVTEPFCSTCVRARLSAIGELFTCLFASKGHDLRGLIRDDRATDIELGDALGRIWGRRTDAYSERRHLGQSQPPDRVEMSYIGG